MAGDKIVRTLLSYGVDESSIRRVEQANQEVKLSLDGVRKAAEQLADTRTQKLAAGLAEGEKQAEQARREFDSLRASLNRGNDELKAMAGNFQEVGKQAGRAAQAADTDVARFRQADSTASRASSILSGAGLSDLGGVADLLSDLSAAAAESGGSLTAAAASLGGVTAASIAIAAPLAVASVGITLFFDKLQKGVQEAQQAADLFVQGAAAQAASNQEVRALILQGDRQVAEERLAGLLDEQRTINETLDAISTRRAEIQEQLGQTDETIMFRIQNSFGGVNKLLYPLLAEYEQLANQANQISVDQLDPVLKLITGITTEVLPALAGMGSTDAPSLQPQIDAINERTRAELEYYRLTQSASSESLQERLAANRVELDALQGSVTEIEALGTTSEETQAALATTNARITQLTSENQELEGSIIPVVAAREAEIEANKRYEKAAAESIRLTNQLADLQVQQREAENQLQAQRNRELEDFQRNRNYQIGDFYDNLAGQDAEFNERQAKSIEDFKEEQAEADSERLDAIQRFNADSVKAAQDLQRDLRRIREDGDESVLESAANLDARGVLAAQRATERQLKERQEAYNEETKERQEQLEETLEKFQEENNERKKNFEQQLKDQRDAFQKQRNAQILDFAERLRREDEARTIRKQRETEDDAIRQANYQRQQDALRTQLDTQNAILRTGYNAMIVASNAFTNQLIANANSLTGGSSSSGGGNTDFNSDFLSPASFRTSSFPSASGIASFPASSSMSSTANNISININGSSGDPVAIATAVRREMISVFNGIAGRR